MSSLLLKKLQAGCQEEVGICSCRLGHCHRASVPGMRSHSHPTPTPSPQRGKPRLQVLVATPSHCCCFLPPTPRHPFHSSSSCLASRLTLPSHALGPYFGLTSPISRHVLVSPFSSSYLLKHLVSNAGQWTSSLPWASLEDFWAQPYLLQLRTCLQMPPQPHCHSASTPPPTGSTGFPPLTCRGTSSRARSDTCSRKQSALAVSWAGRPALPSSLLPSLLTFSFSFK